LSYLDAIIEQQIPMTAANMFWLDTLHDCNLDRSLPLPYDRYRLSNEHRTGRVTSISFDFGQDLSSRFLACASSNNIQPQHLALACYYVVLFKLTNGERDLCIGMNVDNRYRDELKSIIGIFENIIPLRCQLDPDWSFQQLLTYVQEIMTDSLEYSYFPLQRILAQHPNVLKPAFLDTFFEFHPTGNEHIRNEILIVSSQLHAIASLVKLSAHRTMSDCDFALIIEYDLNATQLSCTINASLELFDATTIATTAQRFHSILYQLFQSADDNNRMKKSIYELSLTLSNDKLLMQSMNNTQVSFPSATCIHHEFVHQVMEHSQKLAVQLDDQSLTYSELLYYVQVLALKLLTEERMIVNEIVCQCVERSLSMVS
jgi:non-ribosomal peptide synthetase component F